MRLNKKLETQLNLYKEFNENQILLHELNKALKQRDQYKQAYQHCVDDLIVLRANNKRLERENGGLRTKLENAETYIDAIKTYYPMYENLSNRYNALTNHIRTKAECNPGIWRYIDLVKYIDRLECADDER